MHRHLAERDLGMVQLMLNRLSTYRVLYALKLKERVDRGERLSERDLQFLMRVLSEGAEARSLAARNPQYQSAVDEMSRLYGDIVRQGAENERNARISQRAG